MRATALELLSRIERRYRARALPVLRSVAAPPAGFALGWVDQVSGKLKITAADGTVSTYTPGLAAMVSTRYVLADPFPTLATGIERHKGYLRLAEQPTFLGSSVNDIASPSPGWTYANSSKLTAGTRNAGKLTWTHNAFTNSQASSGTAPFRYRTYRPSHLPARWITRVRHDCNANYEFAGLLITQDASPSTVAGIATGYNGGGYFVGGAGAGDVNVGSTAVVTDGVWLMASLMGGYVTTHYSLATGSTPSTTSSDWVAFATGYAFTYGSLIRVGMYADNGNLGGANTIDFFYWSDSYAYNEGGPVAPPGGGGSGFDATGAVQVLVTSADLGSSSAALTDANVRAALQQVENQLPGDAATITWSVTRASSANPAAATTYQSSSAINVKTGGSDTSTSTGRYLAVRCKITSNGTQRGSVSLMDLRIPFSA
jgi:hypothetical protein